MNVSKITSYNQQLDRMQYVRNQEKRDEDYQKVVERRNFDRIIAERVYRNIRLGLDKGQNVDVDA